MINGDTPDISIFRFPWFTPIWFYCPTLSFPQDKMLPGFFLDIAENTGDGFFYVVLPVNNISDIPTARNPVTLVRSVDVELLGDEELDIVNNDLNEDLSVSEDEQDSIMESYSFLSEHSDAPVETSLTHLDRDMLSIPEETEEPISDEEYMESEPIQVLQQRNTDMPTDSPNPDPSSHPVPMVSQTQPEVEDVDSDDETFDPVAVRYSEGNFDSVVDDVNGVLNPDNYESSATVLLPVYSKCRSRTSPVIPSGIHLNLSKTLMRTQLLTTCSPMILARFRTRNTAVGRLLSSVRSKELYVVYVVATSSDLMLQPTFLLLRSVVLAEVLKQIARMNRKRRSKSKVPSVLVLSNTGSKCLRIEKTYQALMKLQVNPSGRKQLRKRWPH